MKKDLYMIFTIGGLVNLLNYFFQLCLLSCIMSIFLDLPGFWHRDSFLWCFCLLPFLFCFVFEVCNVIPEYNANNHIFKPSVSLLISDNVVPNSYSSIKKKTTFFFKLWSLDCRLQTIDCGLMGGYHLITIVHVMAELFQMNYSFTVYYLSNKFSGLKAFRTHFCNGKVTT